MAWSETDRLRSGGLRSGWQGSGTAGKVGLAAVLHCNGSGKAGSVTFKMEKRMNTLQLEQREYAASMTDRIGSYIDKEGLKPKGKIIAVDAINAVSRFVRQLPWRELMELHAGEHNIVIPVFEKGMDILVLGLQRGDYLPVHDHGNIVGLSTVVAGEAIEIEYETDETVAGVKTVVMRKYRHVKAARDNQRGSIVRKKNIHAVMNVERMEPTVIIEVFAPKLVFGPFHVVGKTLKR